MSIPLNNIVKINPGVLGVGNNGNNLLGLMLTKNGTLPSSISTNIQNQDQVKTLFGGDSIEYKLANIYFSGFTNSDRVAEQLYIAPYYKGDTSASLQGSNISYLTVEQMRALTGAMTINVDGVSKTVEGLNFNAVNSLSDVASVLGEALVGCTVVYSSTTNGLIINSPTKGSNSSVGFATGLLATDLRLSSEQGALQSVSTVNQTLTDLLKMLRQTNLAFCSVFLSWIPTKEERIELAEWANSINGDVCVILNDTDNEAINLKSGASFAEQIAKNKYEGVVCVYDNLELCAFVAGYPAAWDLTKTDGRFTAAFRRNSLLTANITDEQQAIALKENGYNFYGVWASATSNFTFMYEGRISGQYIWLDSWFCQVWMRRQFQYYFVLTLLSRGQIPYNTDGKGILQTAIKPAIDQFMNFGAIRKGVSLSDNQVQALKQEGLNQSQINNITTVGYYLKVDMESVSPQTRLKRGSPPISFWYTDGQSVQQINMNSIEIQ